MRFEKMKTAHQLNQAYKHNYRINPVKNANSEIQNDNLVGGTGTFNSIFKERTKGMRYRKDAIKALELVLTYSPDATVDIHEWEKANVKWLKDTFNIAGDGKDNLVSAVCHLDESTPHIHAMVIPVDDKGHLNGHHWTGGPQKLREMQDSYGEAMSPLGLKRGLKGRALDHKEISKFYRDLTEAREAVPTPRPFEKATKYRERVLDQLKDERIAEFGDRTRTITRQLQEEREKDLKEQKRLKEKTEFLKKDKAEKEEELKKIQNEKKELENAFNNLKYAKDKMKTETTIVAAELKKYENQKHLYEQISNIKKNSPEQYHQIQTFVEQIAQQQQQR